MSTGFFGGKKDLKSDPEKQKKDAGKLQKMYVDKRIRRIERARPQVEEDEALLRVRTAIETQARLSIPSRRLGPTRHRDGSWMDGRHQENQVVASAGRRHS